MDKSTRKAAIAAYRERKTSPGIYAVRCTASGEAWIGQAPDVDAIRNRLWFMLDHGSHPARALQAAWNARGREALTFEVLHRVDPDEAETLGPAGLKDLAAAWRREIGAAAL